MKIIKRNDLPPPKKTKGRRYRFPFDELGVGECFIVKGMMKNCLSPYIAYAQKSLGYEFTSKTTKEGVAVWRIK